MKVKKFVLERHKALFKIKFESEPTHIQKAFLVENSLYFAIKLLHSEVGNVKILKVWRYEKLEGFMTIEKKAVEKIVNELKK